MTEKELKAMLASYGRSVIGAVAARAVNPNDPAFGRLPKASAVEEALKAAKPKKKKSE